MLNRESEILAVPGTHKGSTEEESPVIKETREMVLDTEKVISLIVKVEAPKASLQSEGQAVEDLRKALAVAEAKNLELEANLENVDQLQKSVQRLEEKLSKSESEIQVLRQQAKRNPENENLLYGETKSTPDTNLAIQKPESKDEEHKYLNEKKQEKEDLVKCISQNLGYDEGKHVAACLIYKCLLYWGSFELETTSIFGRIFQKIATAIEAPNNNEVLAYWLSNSATLLLLLQCTLRAPGKPSLTPQRRTTTPPSFFGMIPQTLMESPQCSGFSFLNGRQVEAKYPALLFKQQLMAFLEKIYEMIRDSIKKEISPLLASCIQAPRTSRVSLVKERGQENDVAQQGLIAHWQNIRKSLNSYLNLLKENNAPTFLVRKIFTQIFCFINVKLFNSLLLHRECCSFSSGEYFRAGLAELEQWFVEATGEFAGSAWDELRHVRQAVGFLVICQKPKKTLEEITRELCPVLSIQQLHRISTLYWDDKYGTHNVSLDVVANMKVMMTEDLNNVVSSSFLLEDDPKSVPFTVENLSKAMSLEPVDIYDIKPPQFIRENPEFSFLLTTHEGDNST